MFCIYCKHPYTYTLGNGQRKCSKCKRKFSPAKIAREQKLKRYFMAGDNASVVSRKTGMHPVTIQKYYETFRKELAYESDLMYQKHAHLVNGYDEYLYLPKSLKIDDHIEKLQHFFTLSYEQKVYSLMMPSPRILAGHYSAEIKEKRLLLKYLKFNKIAKLSKAQNTITQFWEYFEEFILQYKGVSHEQFVFYLKEAEWRFNTMQKRL